MLFHTIQFIQTAPDFLIKINIKLSFLRNENILTTFTALKRPQAIKAAASKPVTSLTIA